jgi:dTDP-4-dehydrorhamnose 3,5-epimerase
MQRLAEQGVSPSVVGDQIGRPTFTTELARATRHLLDVRAPYGTYNVSNGGAALSWADLAREVFRLSGRDPGDVTTVTTEEYDAGRTSAPRPRNSALDLSKLIATGFEPEDALVALRRYCSSSSQRP